jgi:signal transduction histidine kinase
MDPRFSAKADRDSGFKTKNLICIPLMGHKHNCIGTMQVINKKTDGPVKRGLHNVERLIDLQYKVDDIVHQRVVDVVPTYYSQIEDMKYFIEEYGENKNNTQNIVSHLMERIDSILTVKNNEPSTMDLTGYLEKLADRSLSAAANRQVDITLDIPSSLSIFIDEKTLEKACGGLLKNAVENTPDQGLIKISAGTDDQSIRVKIRDYGVGITQKSGLHIFSGLFHTQETIKYSSKRPFEFNAGGSGTDLLRIKVIAERLGFFIDYSSTRCPCIPTDESQCPGNISLCSHIQDKKDCINSGGSIFTLTFPKKKYAGR